MVRRLVRPRSLFAVAAHRSAGARHGRSAGVARRLVAADGVEQPLGRAGLAYARRAEGLPGLSDRPQSVNRHAALPLLFVIALGAALAAGCTRSTPPVPPKAKTWPRPSFQPQPLDVSQLPLAHPGCNIVLVSFDALQAAHVGCLGYDRDTTPHLDDFAERSFTFAKAYSASSWTVP